MPELIELIPWDNVSWDNMESKSGTGHIKMRPYYFRILGMGEQTKLILISSVPSKTRIGSLHATDYLRLDCQAFKRLIEVGEQAFSTSPAL